MWGFFPTICVRVCVGFFSNHLREGVCVLFFSHRLREGVCFVFF